MVLFPMCDLALLLVTMGRSKLTTAINLLKRAVKILIEV